MNLKFLVFNIKDPFPRYRSQFNTSNFLHRDLVTELGRVKINKIAKIMFKFPYLTHSKLYEYLTVLKTVVWDLLVERDIPDGCCGKAMHWRKIIILHFTSWRMNPPPPPPQKEINYE